ncbi:MAG: hypothetical protein IKK43_03525, partial [Clostridia bacterium]|nr:hypothetical protein [Clostridia bacterium]
EHQYKEGFIIVMFEIVTRDTTSVTKHEEDQYLVYKDQPVGNQWKNEGGAKLGEASTMKLIMPRLSDVGTQEVNLPLEGRTAYPVAIYDVAVRASGNYEIAGTH